MSYILDALRKADQQRKHGGVPTLPGSQEVLPGTDRPTWPRNLGLAALVLLLGVGIGWLQPWRGQSVTPTPAPPAPVPAPSAPAPSASGPNPPVAGSEQLPRSPAGPAAMGPGQDVPVGTPPPASTHVRSGTTTDPEIRPGSPQIPPMPAGSVTFAPSGGATGDMAPTPAPDTAVGHTLPAGKRVFALQELPASVRQGIPNLVIAFHAYSPRPEERRVMVNNELLRQGDALAGGLQLEEITPDGVVFSYRGHRFAQAVR